MRTIPLRSIAALALACSASLCADDPADHHKKGIEALKDSQSNPDSIVAAARHFANASAQYEAKGQTDLAVEMNSYLYWCKKKMSLKDIDAFLKTGETSVSERLTAVESKPVAPNEAQAFLERADAFARTNPKEKFLAAVRYFEVAERFKDTDPGRIAMKNSLAAMQEVLVTQKTPPAATSVTKPKAGKTINLLPLIDPAKDAVSGNWRFTDGVLSVESSAIDRIEIPYQPPEEYDFKMVFMRAKGDNVISQIMTKGEHQFMWCIDGWNSIASGIENIDGKRSKENETTFKGKLVTNGRWHTSIVQVRNAGITVLFDGKPILKFSTNYSNLKLDPDWKLRDKTVIGLGQGGGKLGIATVELTELTGTGKKTR